MSQQPSVKKLTRVIPISTAVHDAMAGFVGGSASITTATIDFAVAGADATAGKVTFTATSTDFAALVYGKSSPITPTAFNYSGFVAGKNVQGSVAAITVFDYTSAPAIFTVSDGVNSKVVTLDADYTDVDGVAAAIQTQVRTGGGNLATVTVTNVAGVITITNTGFVSAISVSSLDADAVASNFSSSAGVVGANTPNVTFSVNGEAITLDSDTTDLAGFAAALTVELQASALGANYSADVVGVTVVINQTNNTAAVAITSAGAAAIAAGIVNSAGVAGAASKSVTLTIGGQSVPLLLNYGTFNTMRNAIAVAMGVNFDVSIDNPGWPGSCVFVISRLTTGSGSSAVSISGGNASSNAAGITSGGTRSGTAGTDVVLTTNASFRVTSTGVTVDTTNVTLDATYASQAAVLSALQTKLPGYTVGRSGNIYTITSNSRHLPVTITGISSQQTAALGGGFVNSAGTAGTAAVPLLTVTTTGNHLLTSTNQVTVRSTNVAIASQQAVVTVTGATTFTIPQSEAYGGYVSIETDNFPTGFTGVTPSVGLGRTNGNSAVVQSVVTGTGGAVTVIEASLNGTAWSTIGTLTNTGVDGNAQFLTIEPAWAFVRANVTSVGASTKLEVWKSS